MAAGRRMPEPPDRAGLRKLQSTENEAALGPNPAYLRARTAGRRVASRSSATPDAPSGTRIDDPWRPPKPQARGPHRVLRALARLLGAVAPPGRRTPQARTSHTCGAWHRAPGYVVHGAREASTAGRERSVLAQTRRTSGPPWSVRESGWPSSAGTGASFNAVVETCGIRAKQSERPGVEG